MKTLTVFTLAVALLAPVLLFGQTSHVAKGAPVYIAEMDQDLDGYIRAEIVKQKVPLQVVLTPEEAQFILTGSATPERKRSWAEGCSRSRKTKLRATSCSLIEWPTNWSGRPRQAIAAGSGER